MVSLAATGPCLRDREKPQADGLAGLGILGAGQEPLGPLRALQALPDAWVWSIFMQTCPSCSWKGTWRSPRLSLSLDRIGNGEPKSRSRLDWESSARFHPARWLLRQVPVSPGFLSYSKALQETPAV